MFLGVSNARQTYLICSELPTVNGGYSKMNEDASKATLLFSQTVRFDTLVRKAYAGVRLLLYRARKLCRQQAATLSIHILYKDALQTI